MAMVAVARVSSYRGFIFVNQTAEGPSLEDWLGYMTTSLDDMVDRAPDGEIEVAGGSFKHTYNGNWKLYLENLCDAAHPWFTHRSSIDAAQQQSDDAFSDGAGEIAMRQMRQNGAPYSFWESQVGIWTYPKGHSFLGDYHDDKKLVAALMIRPFATISTQWKKKKGKEKRSGSWKSAAGTAIVYPNLSFMSQFQQLRVIHPFAVNRTLVCTYSFKCAARRNGCSTIPFASPMWSMVPARWSSPTIWKSTTGSASVYRAKALNGCRSAAVSRATYRMSTAAAAARIPPARSTFATCSTRGSATWSPAARGRCGRWREPSGMMATGKPWSSDAGVNRLDVRACELFLLHEARLLDEGKFDDWLALFTPEARYWVPSEPDRRARWTPCR